MSEIPFGYCQCGCGEKTSIANKNDRWNGMVKGQPRRFLPNHHASVTNHPRRVLDVRDYSKRDTGFTTPCWLWLGSTRGAYGKIGIGGKYVSAHVAYYEALVGPVPEGMELDHLCRVTICVNPHHLEPVTHRENCLRGTNTKIPNETIDEIRSAKGTLKQIAERFGISITHASDIRRGLTRS